MSDTFDVVGIGNAVVDVLSSADDNFLDIMGIEKGIMQLVEQTRAETLFAAMTERRHAAGGSVANTIAGLGTLGLRTGFMGRVRDDALGKFYAEEMEKEGTAFLNPPVPEGELPTSRTMIFITPDGERSMNTYLGISAELSGTDVDKAAVGRARILFLEGYLYDKDKGKEAFEAAAAACRAAGGKAGIALSDPFCVDRHRQSFRQLVTQLDYVIGNKHEWTSLYETETLEEALTQAAKDCELVVCTRSGDPVVLIQGTNRVEVPVTTVTPVDATGAGDQFAAGFLYGIATGKDLETAGKMGCIAAAEVISHIGPRPEANIQHLFRQAGLI